MVIKLKWSLSYDMKIFIKKMNQFTWKYIHKVTNILIKVK